MSTGGMIALVPADPDLLTVPGGDPAGEMHLTLAYLGDDAGAFSPEQVAALHDAVQGISGMWASPFEADVFGHAAFNPNGGDHEPCAVYLASADQLGTLAEHTQEQARSALGAQMPDQHPTFVPHITAGYGLDPSALSYTGPVTFNAVRLALADEVTDYPMGEPMADTIDTPGESTVDQLATAPDDPTLQPQQPATPQVVEVGQRNPDGSLPITFPALVVEGMQTADGRYIEPGALDARALPLTVFGMIRNPDGGGDGHDGALVAGRLDTLDRIPGTQVINRQTGQPFGDGVFVWSATGELMAGPVADFVERRYLTGVSADLIGLEAEEIYGEELAPDVPPEATQLRLYKGTIAACTIAGIPAFGEAYVEPTGQPLLPGPDDYALAASASWRSAELGDWSPVALTASADTDIPADATAAPLVPVQASGPFRPPLSAFAQPSVDGPTPITVVPEQWGLRVYGHIGDRSIPHISFSGQKIYIPRSRSDYQYFNTGAVRCIDGAGVDRVVAVGRLTVGKGHADLDMSSREATRFYDNPDSAWAWVTAYDDEFGCVVAGVVIPGTPDELVTTALAHPPSGDWRPIGGVLELVAAISVNTSGFPVARARVASGQVQALVAAGALRPADTALTALRAEVADLRAAVTALNTQRWADQTAHLLASFHADERAALLAELAADGNQLEQYWKHGEGAAKIRWGTPGDWTRCHAQLTKHVGSERAKRICAQWHHDVTGVWPGDKNNP